MMPRDTIQAGRQPNGDLILFQADGPFISWGQISGHPGDVLATTLSHEDVVAIRDWCDERLEAA